VQEEKGATEKSAGPRQAEVVQVEGVGVGLSSGPLVCFDEAEAGKYVSMSEL